MHDPVGYGGRAVGVTVVAKAVTPGACVFFVSSMHMDRVVVVVTVTIFTVVVTVLPTGFLIQSAPETARMAKLYLRWIRITTTCW